MGKEPGDLPKVLAAEFMGAFVWVAAVCGFSMISFGGAGGSGPLGVAFGVGLSVMVMAYTVGPISGGHFNPAVTLGIWAAGRFRAKGIAPYIIAQVIGGAAAALVFYIILSSQAGWSPGGFASNGYGAHSPRGFSMAAALITELVQTAFVVFVILQVTRPKAPAGVAPIAVGLTLAAMHIISIPVTNTSLNPARSTATALFAEGWALEQLWLFWVAPIAGGLIGGTLDRWLGPVGDYERQSTE